MQLHPNKKLKIDENNSFDSSFMLTHQPNFIELELNELLNEISLPNKLVKRCNDSIMRIRKLVKNLKPIENIKYADKQVFENSEQKIEIPLLDLCKKMDGSYSFKPPSNIHTIGSFELETILKKCICVDLLVEMPDDYFTERDYLNYRYFMKRNLYMAHVLHQLLSTANNNDSKTRFNFNFKSNYSTAHFKPYLCLDLISEEKENIEFLLHFVPSRESFRDLRFLPTQNNVRFDWFKKQFSLNDNYENEIENEANPFYNFEILRDLRSLENNQFLSENLPSDHKNLRDAIKLIKLWLHKRSLNLSSGDCSSFDNFTLSMYLVYLLKNKKINAQMTSNQVFRLTLFELSESNWDSNGISLKENQTINQNDEFHKHYEVVFLDQSGQLNLTSKLSKSTYWRVKHEAKLSIKLLNNKTISDCFQLLFIHDYSIQDCFDSFISLELNNNYFKLIQNEMEKKFIVDYYNNCYFSSLKVILKYVFKCLSQRVDLVYIKPIEGLKWSVNEKVEKIQDVIPKCVICLLFNENFDNKLIKGPSSLNPEAVEFRKFWASKSELRRFEDTSICEAVYFDSKDESSKKLIYAEIVKHIFKTHFDLDDVNFKFCDRQLNSLLSVPEGTIKSSKNVNQYGTGEEYLQECSSRFQELAKLIKNLSNELPIPILNIQPVSSAFRLTETFAPFPCNFNYSDKIKNSFQIKLEQKYVPKHTFGKVTPPYVEPLEVFIQLESSGKWPDQLDCIYRLKTAFYMKLVKLIRQSLGLNAFTHVNYCDIFYKGYVFRLSAFTMNEIFCMKNYVNENGLIMPREMKESIDYEKERLYLPKITGVISNLSSQQKTKCFSVCCRLIKRWLSSQFLADFFDDIVVELMCSYLFLDNSPYDIPKSAISGFIKFLRFFSTFDWKNDILILNFNNELKNEEIESIRLNFKNNRSKLPAACMVTPYDGKQYLNESIWTLNKPSVSELCRSVLLAKQSHKYLRYCMENFESNELFKNIFRPNCQNFDIVIQLKANYCPRAYQSVDLCEDTFLPHYVDYENEADIDKTFPIVGFDLADFYVKELRSCFSDLIYFYYDKYGGTKIYGLWKQKKQQNMIENASFKYCLINKMTKNVELNLEAIVDDFKLIGNGLVQNVEIKNFLM